jgi:Secretion system C-terminal sorting domain
MRKLLLCASILFSIHSCAQIRWKTFGTIKDYNWNEVIVLLDSNKIWSRNWIYLPDTIDSFKGALQIDLYDKLNGIKTAVKLREYGFSFGLQFRIASIGNQNFSPDIVCFNHNKKSFLSARCLVDTVNLTTQQDWLFENYLVKYSSNTGLPLFSKKFSKFTDREPIVSIKMLAADTIAIATTLLLNQSTSATGRRMGYYLLDTNANVLFSDTFTSKNDEICDNAVMDAHKNSYLCGYIDTFTKNNGPGYEWHWKGILRKVDRYGKSIALGDVVQHSSGGDPYIMSNGHQFADGKFMTIAHNSTNYLWTDDFFGFFNQWQIGWYDTNLNLIKSDSILRVGYNFICGVKPLKGNRHLLFGCGTKDTNRAKPGFDPTVYGFATVLDSNGKIIWDRQFNFRDRADHYFTSAEQDDDGSIYLAGLVFEKDSVPRANVLLRLDSMGCFDNSCYPMDVVEIVGLHQDDIVVSPNPANSVVRIQLKDANYCGGFMGIYNSNGQLVQRVSLHSTDHAIDVSSWPKGIYFLSYEHRKYFYKGKIVVQ